MSRKSLRSQLDELSREKEHLEAENVRLEGARKGEPDLLAELERLRKENERLVNVRHETDEADANGREQSDAE